MDYARHDYFDVWFPLLAPSRQLMRWAKNRDPEENWPEFARRYEREMLNHADSRQAMALLARLAHVTPIAVGCFCGNEKRCHRSLLQRLIRNAGSR